MIRRKPLLHCEVDGRGYRLETGDLNVLYERSVIHAEHGTVRKVHCLFKRKFDIRQSKDLKLF